MTLITDPGYIRCRFDPDLEEKPGEYRGNLEVYFSDTNNLSSLYPDLLGCISDEEKVKAGKIIPEKIRETYIISHAVLRLCLATYLNRNPKEILFNYSTHSKPGIEKDPVYFNLSHTNGAFAFAISKICYVGIDIEGIDRKFDIHSVMKSYFSKSEQDYIVDSEEEKEARFFLLWTRKESFLKALGTGIIDDLSSIEVSGQNNIIKRNVIDNMISGAIAGSHYIFSARDQDKVISVTVPVYPLIKLNQITTVDIINLLSNNQ